MDAGTGRRLAESAHLRQSVADILCTPLGARVMRRDYGSLLPELIDQPLNGATRLRAYAAAVIALMMWEPRLRLTSVAFGMQGASLIIDITGSRIDGPRGARPVSLSVPLRGGV